MKKSSDYIIFRIFTELKDYKKIKKIIHKLNINTFNAPFKI